MGCGELGSRERCVGVQSPAPQSVTMMSPQLQCLREDTAVPWEPRVPVPTLVTGFGDVNLYINIYININIFFS